MDECPFKVGDKVKFVPQPHTYASYQNIEGFGIKIGEVITIKKIVDNVYIFGGEETGGWPWNEFQLAEASKAL